MNDISKDLKYLFEKTENVSEKLITRMPSITLTKKSSGAYGYTNVKVTNPPSSEYTFINAQVVTSSISNMNGGQITPLYYGQDSLYFTYYFPFGTGAAQPLYFRITYAKL